MIPKALHCVPWWANLLQPAVIRYHLATWPSKACYASNPKSLTHQGGSWHILLLVPNFLSAQHESQRLCPWKVPLSQILSIIICTGEDPGELCAKIWGLCFLIQFPNSVWSGWSALERSLNETCRSESRPHLEVQAASQGDGYIKIAKQLNSFFRVYFGFTAPLIIIPCVTSLLPDINPCRAACSCKCEQGGLWM